MNNFKYNAIIIFLISGFFLPGFASGAILYLQPAQSEHQLGSVFTLDARLDTEGDCVNAIFGEIGYDKNVLEAVDFGVGSSIINLWLGNPEIRQDKGLISFSGGMPGGYCGRLSGDPGSADLLGKIIFRAKQNTSDLPGGAANVRFEKNSKVLLNDGLGAEAKLNLEKANIVVSDSQIEPGNQWQKQLSEDSIPPELFEIVLQKDEGLFNGQYFVIFQTTDKQTGIAHYEVQEISQGIEGMWITAQSPYVLQDQSLRSIIKVKAVDKAGNERIIELKQPKSRMFWWIVLFLVVLAVIIVIIIRR